MQEEYQKFCSSNDISVLPQIQSLIAKESTVLTLINRMQSANDNNNNNNHNSSNGNTQESNVDEIVLNASYALQCNFRNLLQMQVKDYSLSFDHMSSFLWGLNYNTNIQELLFVSCEIDDQTVIALSLWLASNRTLLEINLASNKITDLGADHLLKSIASHPCLVSIDISKNSIQSDFITQHILQNNKSTLESINISGNPYELHSVESTLQSLLNNESLKQLHMRDIHIASIHIHLFLEVLRHNRTLTSLQINLPENVTQPDSQLLSTFEHALVTNTTIEDLAIGFQLSPSMMDCLKANEILHSKEEQSFAEILQKLHSSSSQSQPLKAILEEKISKIMADQRNGNGISYLTEATLHPPPTRILTLSSSSSAALLPPSAASAQVNNVPTMHSTHFNPLNTQSDRLLKPFHKITNAADNSLLVQSQINHSQILIDAKLAESTTNLSYQSQQPRQHRHQLSGTFHPFQQAINAESNQLIMQDYQPDEDDVILQQSQQCASSQISHTQFINQELKDKLQLDNIKSYIDRQINDAVSQMHKRIEEQDVYISRLASEFDSLKRDFENCQKKIQTEVSAPVRKRSYVSYYDTEDECQQSQYLMPPMQKHSYHQRGEDEKILQSRINQFQMKVDRAHDSVVESRLQINNHNTQQYSHHQEDSCSRSRRTGHIVPEEYKQSQLLSSHSRPSSRSYHSSQLQQQQQSQNQLNGSVLNDITNMQQLSSLKTSIILLPTSQKKSSQQQQQYMLPRQQASVLKVRDLTAAQHVESTTSGKKIPIAQRTNISQNDQENNSLFQSLQGNTPSRGYMSTNKKMKNSESQFSSSSYHKQQKGYSTVNPSEELLEELRRRGLQIN